jgi:hypothetical protein
MGTFCDRGDIVRAKDFALKVRFLILNNKLSPRSKNTATMTNQFNPFMKNRKI